MGSENLTPIEELQRLDRQIDQVNELAELKPIFYRVEELARAHSGDFDVQLAAGEVKQHVIDRGTRLKRQPPAPPPPVAATPPPETGSLPAAAPPDETVTEPHVAVPATEPATAPLAPAAPPPPQTATPPPPISAAPPPAAPPVTATPPPPDAAPALPRQGAPPGSEIPPKEFPKTHAVPPPSPPQAAAPAKPGVPPPLPPAAAPPPVPSPAAEAVRRVRIPPAAPKPSAPSTPQPATEPARSSVPAAPAGVPLTTAESAAPGAAAAPSQGAMRGGGPPSKTPPPKRPPDMQRAVLIGAGIGVAAALILIVVLVNVARNRDRAAGDVDVAVTTTPSGASVRMNGEELCVSDCTTQLAPGSYQLTALLDGYEPSAADVTIAPGQPASVSLALLAQPQTVRLYADLAAGNVTLDGERAGALQDGQFVLERVAPGPHTVRVTGGDSEASFGFDLANASLPAVTGTVSTRNLLAILVASFAGQARVVTSSGPLKLALNGAPQEDAGPAGVDLRDYQPGEAELVLGAGNNQRTVSDTFGPAPTLTAFLKTDQDVGTLIIATGQDDVRVFLNGRELPNRTQRGQLRVQIIGRQVVRVAKEGFEELPPRIVTVAKGSESRLTFSMKALPEFSSLLITGGTPGAEVLIDGQVVGTVSPEGGFRNSSVSPGDRGIEIRRPQFEPKRFNRTFRRGQTIAIGDADAVLVAVREAAPPAPPAPPPKPKPEAPKVVAAPKPRTGTIANFDAPDAWRQEDGIWRHRGEARLTYSMLPADGVFTFTIYLIRGGNRLLFRGGRVRWFADYQDERNYASFELDNETFWARDVVDGKSTERVKVQHNLDGDLRSWTVQVDIAESRIITRIQRGSEWVVLDTWPQAGRDFTGGKFGIQVNGNDEVGLSDFRFTAR